MTDVWTGDAENSHSPTESRLLLGTVLGHPDVQVTLPFDDIIHAAVFGQSGLGKTVLLQHILEACLRDIIHAILQGDQPDRPRRSIAVFEPHGGLIDACLAIIAKCTPPEHLRKVLTRVHYLALSNIDLQFAFDPTFFGPSSDVPQHRLPSKLVAHIRRQADMMAETFVRQHTQSLTDTPLLRRLLKTLLTVAQYAQLPFEFLEWLLDVHDELADRMVSAVLPRLPRRLRSFLIRLRQDLRGRDKRIADSTLNRLEEVLTEVGRTFFCRIDDPRTFDFRKELAEPAIYLVDCRESDDTSEVHGDVFGGLLLNRLLTCIKSYAPGSIPRLYCFVDEASRYVGLDIDRNMLALRKWASLWLCTQDVSSLQRGELDLSDKILSQTNAAITFAQSSDKDLKVLVPRICRSNISFEEKVRLQQLHAGFLIVPYTKRSRTRQRSSTTASRESTATGAAESAGTRQGTSARIGDAGSPTTSSQDARNLTTSTTSTTGSDRSSTEGAAETESDEFLTLPQYDLREQPDGLRTDLTVQWEQLSQQIYRLRRAQIVAKLPGFEQALPIQVVQVEAPFATPAFQQAMIDRLLDRLRTVHDYYLIEPDLTDEAHEQRLRQWIDEATGSAPPAGVQRDEGAGNPGRGPSPFLPEE